MGGSGAVQEMVPLDTANRTGVPDHRGLASVCPAFLFVFSVR